jgi:hypothetical protein
MTYQIEPVSPFLDENILITLRYQERETGD